MKKAIKEIFKRGEWMAEEVKEFAHNHKDLLVIVADPHTDQMFVGYNDSMILGKVKGTRGETMGVVRAVLNKSKFSSKIDQFLTSISETLWSPIWGTLRNKFYQFIDGALFNIADIDKQKPSTIIKEKGSQEISKING